MWRVENFAFWWRVERTLLFLWEKALKYQGFSMKKTEGKSSFGVVFLFQVYYNVVNSGVKWFFVVEKHRKSGEVEKWRKVVTARCS